MTRCVQGDRVEFADREALADEQMVELAAVALEFGRGTEDLAEDVLDDTNVLADAERAAELLLDVGRGREMVGVDVALEDPLDLKPVLLDEGGELVCRSGRCPA